MSKEFKIQFDMGNDAFRESPEMEVSSILEKIDYQVNRGYQGAKIIDSNGNSIGAWEIKNSNGGENVSNIL